MTNMITKEMTMGEILQRWPRSAEIFQDYGLHCFGCHVNIFESLADGVAAHGMDEKTMNELLDDLNKLASDKPDEEFAITDEAVVKLKELIKQQKKDDYGIRIRIISSGAAVTYDMDFENTKQSDDTVIENDGLTFYIDKKTNPMLKGMTLKYVVTDQGDGFKFLRKGEE
jgi:iron-sulfur cluster assembly accessory protein